MGATWHLGHVAEPREPTRAPEWRENDTWLLFIFTIYMIYNVYRSPDYRETSLLTLLTIAPYTPEYFCLFLPCGTKSHTVIFISGDVADGGALD